MVIVKLSDDPGLVLIRIWIRGVERNLKASVEDLVNLIYF
jgi:hypothetical protein